MQKENEMGMEVKANEEQERKTRVIHRGGASEAVYGLGMIGAWVYYITHAATFWMGVLGIFKGIFWPAVLVYEAMKFLGM
jgi:hypothetical protein